MAAVHRIAAAVPHVDGDERSQCHARPAGCALHTGDDRRSHQVGFQKLELWDSIGTAAGGQFVVNGSPQTGGHEIDVAPGDVANTVFDVGTLGGTDTLWAQLLERQRPATGWQPFTVSAPAAQLPTDGE